MGRIIQYRIVKFKPMSKQLNLFQESYEDYYKRFYRKQLQEGRESRIKKSEPLTVIMISTGEVRPMTTNDLKLKL
jgi:hypothetical protein